MGSVEWHPPLEFLTDMLNSCTTRLPAFFKTLMTVFRVPWPVHCLSPVTHLSWAIVTLFMSESRNSGSEDPPDPLGRSAGGWKSGMSFCRGSDILPGALATVASDEQPHSHPRPKPLLPFFPVLRNSSSCLKPYNFSFCSCSLSCFKKKKTFFFDRVFTFIKLLSQHEAERSNRLGVTWTHQLLLLASRDCQWLHWKFMCDLSTCPQVEGKKRLAAGKKSFLMCH